MGMVAQRLMTDGVQEMGLTQSDRTINEQGIEAFGGDIGHADAGGIREPVPAALHEGLEHISGVQLRTRRLAGRRLDVPSALRTHERRRGGPMPVTLDVPWPGG